MAETNIEIIEASWAEWGRTGEPPWGLLGEDVRVHDHDIPDADEYVGRTGVERWLGDWDEAWSEYTIMPEEFLDAGEDRVLLLLVMRATGRGSGVVVEREDALLYTLDGGKVTRMEYFNDRARARETAGL